MPKFRLNKLVRDGFVEEYKKTNQKATYIKLSEEGHKTQLVSKIVEEALEIKLDRPKDEVAKEIADIEQAISDLMKVCNITPEQIEILKQEKFKKLGGFIGGNFVDTIEIADDDEWVKYYRSNPDVFPEV